MLMAVAVPILAAKCLSCHDAESKAADLDLTSRESMMRGSTSGPVVVPGKPEESRLFRYVKMGKMPPARPLSDEEIEAIRQWIVEGAPWDATTPEKPRNKAELHRWDLQPPLAAPQPLRSLLVSNTELLQPSSTALWHPRGHETARRNLVDRDASSIQRSNQLIPRESGPGLDQIFKFLVAGNSRGHLLHHHRNPIPWHPVRRHTRAGAAATSIFSGP